MFHKFTGIGENYIINLALINYVIDKKTVRIIITAFDEIEVVETLEEIQDILRQHYKRQTSYQSN